MTTVEVPIAEVRQLCTSALATAGLGQPDADVVVDDYLETEAAGRVSHGLAGFDVAIANAKNRGQSTLLLDSEAIVVVEGNGDMGHVVYHRYVPQVAAKAKANGVAVLAARNVSRIASPAVVSRRLADEDLASITMEYGGQAFVAHPDDCEPVTSTNPISIGFPYRGGPYPILDMATSERAYFFIKLAETLGQPIPSTWARDADGKPVSDPAHAHSLAALGGYKGFGLSFMFELLTAAMLGVPAGKRGALGVRGILTIALRPDAFGSSRDAVDAAVAALVADLGPAQYPGLASGQKLAAVRAQGVLNVEDSTLQKLRQLAARGQ
jgi:ureidoglycolate dehydrogenase (NAD+)